MRCEKFFLGLVLVFVGNLPGPLSANENEAIRFSENALHCQAHLDNEPTLKMRQGVSVAQRLRAQVRKDLNGLDRFRLLFPHSLPPEVTTYRLEGEFSLSSPLQIYTRLEHLITYFNSPSLQRGNQSAVVRIKGRQEIKGFLEELPEWENATPIFDERRSHHEDSTRNLKIFQAVSVLAGGVLFVGAQSFGPISYLCLVGAGVAIHRLKTACRKWDRWLIKESFVSHVERLNDRIQQPQDTKKTHWFYHGSTVDEKERVRYLDWIYHEHPREEPELLIFIWSAPKIKDVLIEQSPSRPQFQIERFDFR